MAKLRKFSAYRRLERPYTRKSKYREKSFVRATPTNKVIRFDMGDFKKDYDTEVILRVGQPIQIRHNALESARQTANRCLEGRAGKNNYWLKLRVYPHHVLRENPLASGAGADRMSTGMKKSFGKAIGLAAQLKKGQVLFSAKVQNNHIKVAKDAMKKIYCKLPCKCFIEITDLKSGEKKTEPVEEISKEDDSEKTTDEKNAEDVSPEKAPEQTHEESPEKIETPETAVVEGAISEEQPEESPEENKTSENENFFEEKKE